MTVESFYGECVTRSIRLWIEGDNLRVAAPKGELTESVIGAIRAFKPQLMVYLASLPPVDPVPGVQETQEPERILDLFEDAELLQIAFCYDDRGWCESRIGSELVCLCVDSSSMTLTTPSLSQVRASERFGDSFLVVYRMAEIEALKAVGITCDCPALHAYHADKRALIESLDIGVVGYLRSQRFQHLHGTWDSLIKRAEFLSPGIQSRAEILLRVLVAGGQFVEVPKTISCGDTYTMIRVATGMDRNPVFLHGTRSATEDTASGFDDPFAEIK